MTNLLVHPGPASPLCWKQLGCRPHHPLPPALNRNTPLESIQSMDQIPIKDTKAFVVSFPLKEVCQENLSAFIYLPEAEFLGEIQTKVLTVFLLAINSHLSALP
jgi:hypothetical protein